jgi:hypothetical protein
MILNRSRRRPLLGKPGRMLALVALLVALHAGTASAQFGMGWGFGMGMGMGNNGFQTQQQVNKMSQIAASSAYAARGGPGGRGITPYAGNPGAYVNIGRERRFQELDQLRARYSVDTRLPVAESRGPRFNPFTAVAAAPAANEARPDPGLVLASFFNQAGLVGWPADAPTEGDLKDKRETSDRMSLAVLQEYNTEGLARTSTVTQARDLLLDYGRPALQVVRTNSSQALADGFHSFLLGLYEAIGRTATVPNPRVKRP